MQIRIRVDYTAATADKIWVGNSVVPKLTVISLDYLDYIFF